MELEEKETVPLRPLLARLVFDVGRANAAVFFAAFFVLMAGVAASAVPLLRAVRIDPIHYLRSE